MLGAVLKIVGPLVTGFMENRQKVSAAKADLKIQRLPFLALINYFHLRKFKKELPSLQNSSVALSPLHGGFINKLETTI